MDKLEIIQKEFEGGGDNRDESAGEFVRRELLERTSGGGKGREERDMMFGRLFGIMAVCRSGILARSPLELVKGYTRDIINIYHWRKWMRESASHGILVLLSNINNEDTQRSIVNDVIIPSYFASRRDRSGDEDDNINGDNEMSPISSVKELTAEQLGVGASLQHKYCNLSGILAEPLLSKANFPSLGVILAQTSSSGTVIGVNIGEEKESGRSRRHFVFPILQSHFKSASSTGDRLQMLQLLFTDTVCANLLMVEDGAAKDAIHHRRATHDRKVLALALISDFLPLARTPEEIGVILPVATVKKLLLDTLCVSGGPPNLLKPLTQSVLESLIEKDASADWKRGVLKAILACDVRFDQRCQLNCVSRLTSGIVQQHDEEGHVMDWEGSILAGGSSSERGAFVDLLYHFVRKEKDVNCQNRNRVMAFFAVLLLLFTKLSHA